jgi:uncharacterized protein YjbJ (UPF0337 family)
MELSMTKAKAIKNKIAGKAKRAAGEALGDQRLYEEGEAQERRGEREEGEPSELNPLDRLNNLT